MNQQSAVDVYRRDAIETAPPLKLVRMLYQGALRFIDRALECDPKDPQSQFVYWLDRADAIVVELRCALDKSVAPELSGNLEQLYLFCETRLGRAMLSRDPSEVPAVRNVLASLLDGWSTIDVRSQAGG